MISYPIAIDGVVYQNIHVTELKRSFQVLDGENAGRVMNGAMKRDIIGTFYNYSIKVDADNASPQEYDSFYDVVSAPSESHSITVPYAQTTKTYDAYITAGSDTLLLMEDAKNRWGELAFNFIAMEPQRRP